MIQVVQCEIGSLENKVKKITLFVGTIRVGDILFRARAFAWYVKEPGSNPQPKIHRNKYN